MFRAEGNLIVSVTTATKDVRGGTVAELIRTSEDGETIEVCVEEDGFRECGFVSSMHLVPGKCAQLKRAIESEAAQSLLDAAA